MTPEEQLMKTCMEAWGQADNAPVAGALHDDVVWISANERWDARIRSGGIYKGRAFAIEQLSKLSTAYFNTRCVAKEIVSRGEVVWGIFQVTSTYTPVGSLKIVRRPVNWEMAMRWRVRNGKILEAQAFFDTAGLLLQQGFKTLTGPD
jgi:ketosteroid isomerase-like protein